LDHQGIPERDLIPRFQVQRLQNRVAPVHDNLPREVVPTEYSVLVDNVDVAVDPE
jgi:hypothetical protein